MAIVKYRVDSRMLHGQTAAAWGKVLHVDEYIVINEKTANDPMQVTLLQLAGTGCDVKVCSPEEAMELFEEDELEGERTFVVFKTIDDAVELAELGWQMDEISIGGMFEEKGRDRVQYEKCLFVDEHDKECFRKLEAHGVHLVHQVVPEYKESNVKEVPAFNISMTYKLDGNSLIVTVPFKEISYRLKWSSRYKGCWY